MAVRTNLQAWVKLASAADTEWTAYTVDANGEFEATGLTPGETYDVSVPPDYLLRQFVADSAPSVAVADLSAGYDTGVTINPTFGGTNRAYSLSGPSWLAINAATGQITGTTPSIDVSTTATVTVSNAAGSASDTFSIVISEAAATPDVYVNSVSGNDANDGLTPATAIATLSAAQGEINAGPAGIDIGLSAGSYWQETLTTTNKADAVIRGFGTGSLPVIDCAGLVTETWTQPDAATYPNVWAITIPVGEFTGNQDRIMIWEDGVLLDDQLSLANVNSTPGSFRCPDNNVFVSLTTTTVYLHASDSGNPNSNGSTYEKTERRYSVNGAFGPVSGQQAIGISTGRQGHNDGSLVLGKDSLIDGCLAFDGHKHNALQESGTCRDSAFINSRPGTNYMHVFYTPEGAGLTATYTGNLFVGEEDGGRGTSAIYCHDNGGSAHATMTVSKNIFVNMAACTAAASVDLLFEDFYCENVATPFNSLFVPGDNIIRRGMVNGHHGDADSGSEVSISQIATRGDGGSFLRTSANLGASTIDHITAWWPGGSANQFLRRISGGGTLGMTNSILMIDASSGAAFAVNFSGSSPVGTFNNNVYYARSGSKNDLIFSVDGGVTPLTPTQWQALGYDANSLFLDSTDLLLTELLNSDLVNFGDFRLNPSLSLTLPDGTDVRTLGVQEHWNLETNAAVSTAPPRWPTIPKTRANAETWLQDKASWVYYPAQSPVWTDTLADRTLTEGTGTQTYDVSASAAFPGSIVFSLVTPPTGVTISGSTITVDTGATAVQTDTPITVRVSDASNAAAFSDTSFNLTIAAAAGTAPTITALGTATTSSGAGTSQTITCPATSSGQEILLYFYMAEGTASIPANFELVAEVLNTESGSNGSIYVWRWDGTGTRPNASTVTVSHTAAPSGGRFVIADCGGIGNTAVRSPISGNGTFGGTMNVSAGSLTIHAFALRQDVDGTVTTDFSQGATPDETALSPPDDEGSFTIRLTSIQGAYMQSMNQSLAGNHDNMRVSGSFRTRSCVTVELLAIP